MLRLKRILEAKGMSAKGGAELLGISEKTLYNKVTGASEFTYGEVKKLRVMLPEYNLDYLLTDEREGRERRKI